jgi:hypothetical protein
MRAVPHAPVFIAFVHGTGILGCGSWRIERAAGWQVAEVQLALHLNVSAVYYLLTVFFGSSASI